VVLTKGDRIVLVGLAVGSGALLAALAGDLSAALTAGAVARAGHGGAVGAANPITTLLAFRAFSITDTAISCAGFFRALDTAMISDHPSALAFRAFSDDAYHI